MYIPKQFEEKDLIKVAELVREFGFATLISVVDGAPWATHIPLELVINAEGEWLLHGHIARANPQWRQIEQATSVLAVFMGPHSYISPSWYDHRNVPTWNYRAVHLSGRVRIVEGEELEAMLRALMLRYESAHAEKPQGYDEIPKETLSKDLRGLVGLEIHVEKIEAVRKLSQNRTEPSHSSIIDHLRKLDAYDAKRIAEEMNTPKPPLGDLGV
jgi:transcriptional regulator